MSIDVAVNEEKRRKIFFIGFNKCGTTSMHRLFVNCGYRSVHWETSSGRMLAPILFMNNMLGRPLLTGITRYDVFSDMFYLTDDCCLEGNFLFRQMDADYPDALFILNTRDRERWVLSRLKHAPAITGSLVKRARKALDLTEAEVLDLWRSQWDDHHAQVAEYFADKADRFLTYNIETQDISVMADWLGAHGMPVDLAHWKRHNTTVAPKPGAAKAKTGAAKGAKPAEKAAKGQKALAG